MPRQLPPLNTLRAFEAAARSLSFTLAAEELFVTQAAISHQIKTLESALGVSLFRRLNRGLMLTEEGQLLLPAVRTALETLRAGVERLRAQERSGRLTVSAMPSFVATWLIDRLQGFRQLHPDIDLRISASNALANFDRDDVDAAIRWGKGNYPGLAAVPILKEDVFPVCSPRLLKLPGRPLKRPEDLKHHVLLHDDMAIDWRMWLKAAGVSGVDPDHGLWFNRSDHVLQAAVDGQGVALGRSVLAQHDLRKGRLVKPFALTLPVDYAYYFVCPEHAAGRPRVAAFRDWLLGEISGPEPAATPAEPAPDA